MQPSPRPRELEVPQQHTGRRRGHVPQISISDDNHHVTEAIGDMYGDSDWDGRDGRPYSFVDSLSVDDSAGRIPYSDSPGPSYSDAPYGKSTANGDFTNSNGPKMVIKGRNTSFGNNSTPKTPPPLTRTPSSDPASQAFPLNDIDYESSPAAVAQELSNLQAIRRMSMNVDAADPDLPTFSSGFAMPSVAPAHDSDEDDTSRLFWVPASLHPELAPKEFKTFIQDRVDTIRRRRTSGGDGSLSPDSADSRSLSGSLKRRKSMLSHTIDTPVDYDDGADRLERKRSQSNELSNGGNMASLQELESLVNDPSSLVRTLSIDAARKSRDSGIDVPADDLPILPPQPAGQSLKRSTRTNYRRGSLRKGERVSSSRRAAGRLGESDIDESPSSPVGRTFSDGPGFGILRSQTEPINPLPDPPENFSRPSRKGAYASPAPPSERPNSQDDPRTSGDDSKEPRSFHSRIASNGRTTAPLPGFTPAQQQVPEIIETPPPVEYRQPPIPILRDQNIPERKSSHDFSRSNFNNAMTPPERMSLPARTGLARATQPSPGRGQTLDDMANNPSMLPGNSTRTDTLSFIPTYAEEKKPEKKTKERKDSGDSNNSRKSSWGWLLGNNEDKDKDKREREETGKKSKIKLGNKSSEKPLDSARLDVLQTTSEGSRGRESLVLDRESVKLDDERRKDSSRKASGSDGKKAKESGIFSIFGGGKKKNDKDGGNKKRESNRGLSPEPPRKIPVADVDYNWTRFSILEERAIYRMAHIKLANPRRALYSQVLLSNFMYSYLAKVQQMHPQIQIPTFVTQKQQGNQGQQSQVQSQPQNESEEFSQWQRYQEQQSALPDGSSAQNSSGAPATYIDDYDPQHQQQLEDARHSSNGHLNYNDGSPQQQQQQPSSLLMGVYGSEQGFRRTHDNYGEQDLFADSRPSEDRDMWVSVTPPAFLCSVL